MARTDTEKIILAKIEGLQQLNDVDAILDAILLEARKLARADAGTIFLVSRSGLVFSYVQIGTIAETYNDIVVSHYRHYSIPIDEKSIVGYSAATGKQVVIDDVYNIPADAPFSFNSFFDRKTGFKTHSVFALPLKTLGNKLVGVLQLINALDQDEKPATFSKESQKHISLFANYAASAIERAQWSRELILRMIKMAELRDPGETGAHVQRVSAISVEIYHQWAVNRGIDPAQISYFKDLLRPAAMLHDVGKIGIPDEILKKPGKLTDDEFELVKLHTILGANLFETKNSDLDSMSSEVALNHHEKWDGTGYPGHSSGCIVLYDSNKRPKKGEEIPLAARIVAVADVFDALASQRSYKHAWPQEKIYALLLKESGKHFDPELINAFFQITDVVEAIQHRYQDAIQSIRIQAPSSASLKNPNLMTEQQLACGCHEDIFSEIKFIISLIYDNFSFDFIELAFINIQRIFSGRYPGYQASNTNYHNLDHTMSVALASARLIHGECVRGATFTHEIIECGLIAAFFHDTGLIQEQSDLEGTGAKHTKNHENRSILFLRDYLNSQGRAGEYIDFCSEMIKCTRLKVSPPDIVFSSEEARLMGYIIGTADIVAQMSDRIYLERLPMLFKEFREGGVQGYESTLDIYLKTVTFFRNVIRKRLFKEFDGVVNSMRYHFQKRWNIDENLYLSAIENNIRYLEKLNAAYPKDEKYYEQYLRRQINY